MFATDWSGRGLLYIRAYGDMNLLIEKAIEFGYEQIESDVVSINDIAIKMYENN